MTKHILFPIFLVILIIIAIGFLTKKLRPEKSGFNLKENYQTKEISINDVMIKVEIADTEEKRKIGLSQKKRLEKNEGMLFVFENVDTTPSFWMKDMIIPIDILWINNGEIVQIDADVPPPQEKMSDLDLPLYKSETPIDYVLEVNANFCKENNIKTGDYVTNL